MQLVSHLPLSPLHGDMVVPISIDDKPTQLIFDTGAATTILSLKAVQRLGLPHLRADEAGGALVTEGVLTSVGGIGGERTATAVTARKVDIGGLKSRNFNFLAANLDFPPADGLLSVDIISKYDVDLDFPENQVILYYPRGDCSAPAAFLNGPLYSVPLRPEGQDRRPRLNITVNGQNVVAMIDTGANFSAIFRHTAERVGVHMEDASARQHGSGRGIGPQTVASVRMKLDTVDVGDLEFTNMPVEVLDDRRGDEVEMLLGEEFQRRVHLWISYSSHTLIMQYPPTASKKPD